MKPILCNTEVVKNILAGRQTQDRRPLILAKSIDPEYSDAVWELAKKPESYNDNDFAFVDMAHPTESYPFLVTSSRKPGDILYVRETFRIIGQSNNGFKLQLEIQYKDMSRRWFMVDIETFTKYTCDSGWGPNAKWRPCIHMPKWAARIFLKVTGVRVERVRDISRDDAIAEGIYWQNRFGSWPYYGKELAKYVKTPMESFMYLWDSLYPGSWESNDWVWVTEFEMCEKPCKA